MYKPLKIQSVVAFVILLASFSCNEGDDQKPAKPVETWDLKTIQADPNFVSMEYASQLAPRVSKLYTRGKGTAFGKVAAVQKVAQSLSIEEQDIPYYYVFNYEGGGWAIISSDRRTAPLLAFGTEGQFTPADPGSASIVWEGTTKEIIKDFRRPKDEVSDDLAVTSEWTTLECVPDPVRVGNNGKVADCHPLDEFVSQQTVGPLVVTEWGQGCNYNSACPVISGGPCGHALTGCVATAMSQVIRYWQYPAAYNYAAMSNTSGNTSVAALMAAAGGAVGMDYGAGASSANTADVDDALRGSFGYGSASFTNYGSGTYMTVQSNLSANRPVILAACVDQDAILGIPYNYDDCHAWVCDGFQQSNYIGYSVLWFHMNWGWSGSNNGWYQYNNWYVSGVGTFQYNQRAVVNIQP